MTTKSLDSILREHAIMQSLTHEEVDAVAQCGHNAMYATGELLFREGGNADSLYLLRSGHVALELRVEGETVCVERLGSGDVLGWSWLFSPYLWQVTCRALEPTRVLVLDGACLQATMESSPRIGYVITKHLLFHLHQRLDRLRDQKLDVYLPR